MLNYLASPYSAYKGGREAAFTEVCKMAAKLMQEGHSVFCPIAHSHSIEFESGMDVQDGDWWLKQDFAVLDKCERLVVLMMPGWDKSYGVGEEIKRAQELEIEIAFLQSDEST